MVQRPVVQKLTLLYDDTCAFCVRSAAWLRTQRSLLPLELVPCSSARAREEFAAIPHRGKELVIVADTGEVWFGPPAFLMVLWALVEYRDAAISLSTPELLPVAERFFRTLSSERARISGLMTEPACAEDSCRVQGRN